MTLLEERKKGIGDLLRRFRGVRTLTEISKACGISVSYLSDIEHGRTLPSLEMLLKLLDYYDAVLAIRHFTEVEVYEMAIPKETVQKLAEYFQHLANDATILTVNFKKMLEENKA